MKILVAIANYGDSQLQYLNHIVYEYTHYINHDVDVVIHTNIPVGDEMLNYGNVKQIIITDADVCGDWQRLPFTTRKTLLDYPDYDLVIYTENDILVREESIDAYIEASDMLDGTNYIPGFIRYEVREVTRTFPEAHGTYKWDPSVYHEVGDWKFMRYTCDHYGAFVLTSKQMALIQYRNMEFLPEEHVPGYEERTFKVKHCTSIFKNYGLTQVIPVSHIDKFQIRHMSDKYNIKYGNRNLLKELASAMKYAGVNMPNISYCFPYSYEKNLGKAYNAEFEKVGDDDWVCLTDGDAMFLSPDYGHQIGYTIAELSKTYDNFMLTCWTNRVGCKAQRYPQLGVWDEKDITKHQKLAMTLHKKKFAVTHEITIPISGVCMIISKKIWDEIRFAESGILTIDNKFGAEVLARGYKIFLLEGLYILHYYRMNEGRNSISHLM